MRIVLLALLVCVWGAEASAQQTARSLCRELSNYVPIDDVEFNPGASEVPADLSAVQDPVYGSISIPVEIDLAEYFDRPDLAMVPGLNLRPDVVNIEINRNGSVFYNGQEISADIKYYCTEVELNRMRRPKPVSAPVKAKPKPKPKPKPKAKPTPKAKKVVKPMPKPAKKSSVRVFNGPETVIMDAPPIKPKKSNEPKVIIKRRTKVAKPKPVDENAIDVEVLNAQDSTDEVIKNDNDDDSIIEGQYP